MGPPPAAGVQPRAGKTRNPWGVWLLSLVTCGIYTYYWYYKANEEVKDYDANIKVDPVLALLAVAFGGILCLIPPIVSIINTGNRIRQAQQTAGVEERCSGGLGILLAILGGFHEVYYQSQLNKVWDKYGNPAEDTVL
jgi:Domain of unknown function (DUF4234)